MSSPKRRIETDVMKLMMSDYEVTLVNDNMQEFYVIFKGPAESKSIAFHTFYCAPTPRDEGIWSLTWLSSNSAILRRQMESPRRITRPISLQLAIHWLRQPNIPSQHR